MCELLYESRGEAYAARAIKKNEEETVPLPLPNN